MTDDATPSGSDFDSDGAAEDGIPVPQIADRIDLENRQRTIAARLFGEASPLAPVRVGRYVVLRRLGEGGMGVVYAAYDDSLDRKVAIKLLRGGSPNTRRRTEVRLAREAKAMARLSHPNVATVYEVGRHIDEVFIAMELVAGQTLRDWLTRPHPNAEIVRVLILAGRGLAAAHRAELVHRDFKPDNVMVADAEHGSSRSHRVKVMDFGLAAGIEAATEDHPAATSITETRTDEPLTAQGRVVGTPAYMSPEQLRGKDVDARSDQFSFCVTAYEALYGRRPFSAETHDALVESMRKPAPDPVDARGVPRRISSVLRRGLQFDPDQRFADMDALLDALERDPAVRLRRWMLGAGGLGMVAIAGWAAGRLADDDRCRQGHEIANAAWNADRKAKIGEAFIATGLAHAELTWALAAASLDDYASRWAEAHGEACRATRVYASQSESMLELRASCLEHRFGEVEALLDVIERPDAVIVAQVLSAISDLPDLDPCANARSLRERVALPDDPRAREQIDALREEIEQVEAIHRVGQYVEAHRRAEPLLATAEALAHPPILARARLLVGRTSLQTGHEVDGREALKQAVFAAEASGDGELLANAATGLAHALASSADDYAGALDYLALADAAIRRVEGAPSVRIEWHHVHGDVLRRKGALDEAAAEHTEALRLAQGEKPLRSHIVAHERASLAKIEFERGNWDVGLAEFRHVIDMYERELGPTHPASAEMHARLAGAFVLKQRWDEAEREASIAIERFEQALGDDCIQLQNPLSSRASAYMRTGRTDEAQGDLRRALTIVRAHRGAGTTAEAHHLDNLSRLHHRRGELDEAEQALRRAIEITRERRGNHEVLADHLHSLGTVLATKGELDEADALFREVPSVLEASGIPDHPLGAMAVSQRGRIAQLRGRLDDAERLHREAVVRFEAIHDGPNNNTAVGLYFVADLQMQRGDEAGALLDYERALEQIEGAEGSNPMIGGLVRFDLARLLWRDRSRRPRALELARLALDLLAPIDETQAQPVRAWLERHDRG
jgi:eukaryotic-like serine/threonine-protein kinase